MHVYIYVCIYTKMTCAYISCVTFVYGTVCAHYLAHAGELE